MIKISGLLGLKGTFVFLCCERRQRPGCPRTGGELHSHSCSGGWLGQGPS